MKRLLFLLLLPLWATAQPVASTSYFDNVYTVAEQEVGFGGGKERFEQFINNNIEYPKSVAKSTDKLTLVVECLVAPSGKALHVQSDVKGKSPLPEKDTYFIQNQVAYLLVNAPTPLFTPAKINGYVRYKVYKQEVTIGGEQHPDEAYKFKKSKDFYKEPADVHFVEMPPSLPGLDSGDSINKILRKNVPVPELINANTFQFTLFGIINDRGELVSYGLMQPELTREGKWVGYERGLPEYDAYEKWARTVDSYIGTNLKHWKAGTAGGYATYSFIKIPVCLGANCPN